MGFTPPPGVARSSGGLELLHRETLTGDHTIDLTAGNVQDLTAAADLTLTLPDPADLGAGQGVAFTLRLRQDGTGSRTVTLAVAGAGAIHWPGGTAPTLTTTANAVDVLTFFADPDSDVWDGFAAGLAMAAP